MAGGVYGVDPYGQNLYGLGQVYDCAGTIAINFSFAGSLAVPINVSGNMAITTGLAARNANRVFGVTGALPITVSPGPSQLSSIYALSGNLPVNLSLAALEPTVGPLWQLDEACPLDAAWAPSELCEG
jgi:hypothetical protein